MLGPLGAPSERFGQWGRLAYATGTGTIGYVHSASKSFTYNVVDTSLQRRGYLVKHILPNLFFLQVCLHLAHLSVMADPNSITISEIKD